MPAILSLLFFIYLGFPQPIYAQHPIVAAQLVNTIETSTFSPSAPDPAGISYIPSKNKFIISDSEVDEMTIFANKNVYEMTPEGLGTGTFSTLSFSREPTGVSFDPVSNLYFFSNDDSDLITKVNPGIDNILGSSDDSVASFNAKTNAGCTDSEGVFAKDGKIYIAGGIDRKVFITDYSGNLLYSLDVAKYGIVDFEGVTLNPVDNHIFIVAVNPKIILELDSLGNLLKSYDITMLHSKAPADLVFAPTSSTADNPSVNNIYIVDRMVDNNANPTENDGRVYEISINSNNTTSPPSITLSPTVSLTPTIHCPNLTPPACNIGNIIQGIPTPGACPYNICVTHTPTPPAGTKPGDANGDNQVDGLDYVYWLNNYNKNVSTGPSAGDFDRNGFVDGIDYVIWLNNYNK